MGKRVYTTEQLAYIQGKYQELSCREIAENLRINPQAVRNLLRTKFNIKLREVGISSRVWTKREIAILENKALSDYEKTKLLPKRTDAAVRKARRRFGFDSRKIVFKRQFRNAKGYLFIRKDGKYVKNCILVAEKKINRGLKSGEIVHHINGDKRDDRPSNLFVTTRINHPSIHYQTMEIIKKLLERNVVRFNEQEGRYVLCQHL